MTLQLWMAIAYLAIVLTPFSLATLFAVSDHIMLSKLMQERNKTNMTDKKEDC